MLEFVSNGAGQTQRLGEDLATLLEPGDVLLLRGHLGAGKTVLARGIARGLGIEEPVTSPTFTLIREYQGRLPLYHVDLYRIAGASEAADIGLEEYLYGDGVTVVEWGERAAGMVPLSHLAIELHAVDETKRAVRVVPVGERYARLVTALTKKVSASRRRQSARTEHGGA